MTAPSQVEFAEVDRGFYAKIMFWKGFPFGIIFSTFLALLITVPSLLVFVLIKDIVDQENILPIGGSFYAMAGTIIFLIISGLTFYVGIRPENSPDGVKINEIGLQKILGEKTRGESPEGIYWMIPRPIMEIQDPPYSINRQLLNLCFSKNSIVMTDADGNVLGQKGEKPISFADGSELQRTDITIIYRVRKGYLFEVSQIDIIPYLTDIGEDRVRNAAVMLTKFIKKEVKDKRHRGIDAVALLGSLTKWEDLIVNGGSKKSGDSNESELILKPNPDIYDLSLYTDEEQAAVGDLVGIAQSAAEVGIEVLEVTLSSAELPEAILAAINAQLIEITEREKYLEDGKTLTTVALDLIEKSQDQAGNPTITFPEALDRAILAQEKNGASMVTINGTGGNADKITAGLYQTNGVN